MMEFLNRTKSVFCLSFVICYLLFASTAYAVAGKDCSNINLAGTVGFVDIGKILEVFITVIIIVAGLYSFIQLALGGFQYISSAGDKLQTEHARERITYAILGLVIVVGSFAITKILEGIFGINILNGIQFPGADRIVGNLSAC